MVKWCQVMLSGVKCMKCIISVYECQVYHYYVVLSVSKNIIPEKNLAKQKTWFFQNHLPMVYYSHCVRIHVTSVGGNVQWFHSWKMAWSAERWQNVKRLKNHNPDANHGAGNYIKTYIWMCFGVNVDTYTWSIRLRLIFQIFSVDFA